MGTTSQTAREQPGKEQQPKTGEALGQDPGLSIAWKKPRSPEGTSRVVEEHDEHRERLGAQRGLVEEQDDEAKERGVQ